ncbi:hypothetical protein M9458_036560, partial [Cirrhinus mrigala]
GFRRPIQNPMSKRVELRQTGGGTEEQAHAGEQDQDHGTKADLGSGDMVGLDHEAVADSKAMEQKSTMVGQAEQGAMRSVEPTGVPPGSIKADQAGLERPSWP